MHAAAPRECLVTRLTCFDVVRAGPSPLHLSPPRPRPIAIAVPFEEDESNKSIWFLDHNYLEAMFGMYKRINAKEVVVGWYSSGPKIREADMEINELFRRYCADPVLTIVDVNPSDEGIPTKAYVAVENASNESTGGSQRSFVHVMSEIGAEEAEEIGVEHLLRDVKDSTISTLAVEVSAKLGALKSLHSRLQEIRSYLEEVVAQKLPVKHDIMYQLQDIFNMLPNLNVDELVKSFAAQTNDMMLAIYLSSIIRSIIALHNLINNRQELKQWERDADAKEAAKEKKDAADKAEDGAKAADADAAKDEAAKK